MPTRIVASSGYGTGSVGVEVDAHTVVPQERDDTSPTGWRHPAGTEKGGQFAESPSVAEVERAAQEAQAAASANARSQELARQIGNADVGIEVERVEERPDDRVRKTVRFDPDGDGSWREYEVDGNDLRRRR